MLKGGSEPDDSAPRPKPVKKAVSFHESASRAPPTTRPNPDGGEPLPLTAEDEARCADVWRVLAEARVDTLLWPAGSIEALLQEVLCEETSLESRSSSPSSIYRVRHFLRAQVYSPSSRAEGCFLFKKWEQRSGAMRRERNDLPLTPLRLSELPLGDQPEKQCSRAAAAIFQRIEDWHFHTDLDTGDCRDPDVAVESCRFVSHHCEEARPSEAYPGVFDENNYHLVKVLCRGLPEESFATARYLRSPERAGPLTDVTGWCWLTLPKALGEQWRSVNVLEGRAFTAVRPWRDFRSALGELSTDLTKGRALLGEGDGVRVKAADLSLILQRCVASARTARGEHSQAVTAMTTSAYNHPRMQSFIRNTARRETATVDDDLRMSELSLRKGVVGEKSFVRSEGRRSTVPIGAELRLAGLETGDSPYRSPRLPSPRASLPPTLAPRLPPFPLAEVKEEEEGEIAELGGCLGVTPSGDAARAELKRLSLLLGLQFEERAANVCSNDHLLKKTPMKLLALCDICKRVFVSGSTWQCAQCNWNKCPECSDAHISAALHKVREGIRKSQGSGNNSATPAAGNSSSFVMNEEVEGEEPDSTASIVDLWNCESLQAALNGMSIVLAAEFEEMLKDSGHHEEEISASEDSESQDDDDDRRQRAQSTMSCASEIWEGEDGDGGDSSKRDSLGVLMPFDMLSSEEKGGPRLQKARTVSFAPGPEPENPGYNDSNMTDAQRQQRLSLVMIDPAILANLGKAAPEPAPSRRSKDGSRRSKDVMTRAASGRFTVSEPPPMMSRAASGRFTISGDHQEHTEVSHKVPIARSPSNPCCEVSEAVQAAAALESNEVSGEGRPEFARRLSQAESEALDEGAKRLSQRMSRNFTVDSFSITEKDAQGKTFAEAMRNAVAAEDAETMKTSLSMIPDEEEEETHLSDADLQKIHSAVRWGKSTAEIEAVVAECGGSMDRALTSHDPKNGNLALHISAQNNHIDLTRHLIEKKANVNGQNSKGQTALHMAVEYDMYDLTKMLLEEFGASRDIANGDGHSAITGIDGGKIGGEAWDAPLNLIAACTTKADLDAALAKLERWPDKVGSLDKAKLIQTGMANKKRVGTNWDHARFMAVMKTF